MTSWKIHKLGELCSSVIDHRGKTPLKLGGNWVSSGYRALSAKNIKTGQIVQEETIRFVNDSLYKKWMKEEIERGCIIITSEAPFGEVYYWDSDEKIVLSQRLFGLKISKEYDSKFIYYYMRTHNFQEELRGRATGTTVIGLRQPELLKCHISLPPLEEQRRIAGILGAIDDKIENNRRINTNLELQAQALFDEWFVNDSTQPAEYNRASLTDIANYLNGLAMQRFRPQSDEKAIPVLKIKELGQGMCDSSSDICSQSIDSKYIVNDGDIIFSWSGTLLVDIWCGGICGLNQHLFKVTSDKYPKWFVYYWTKYHLAKFIRIAKDKAVTMGHIKRGDLETSEVLIPNAEILSKMDNIIAPIFDAIISRRVENKTLATLRDTLLPKLMNGEIKL